MSAAGERAPRGGLVVPGWGAGPDKPSGPTSTCTATVRPPRRTLAARIASSGRLGSSPRRAPPQGGACERPHPGSAPHAPRLGLDRNTTPSGPASVSRAGSSGPDRRSSSSRAGSARRPDVSRPGRPNRHAGHGQERRQSLARAGTSRYTRPCRPSRSNPSDGRSVRPPRTPGRHARPARWGARPARGGPAPRRSPASVRSTSTRRAASGARATRAPWRSGASPASARRRSRRRSPTSRRPVG